MAIPVRTCQLGTLPSSSFPDGNRLIKILCDHLMQLLKDGLTSFTFAALQRPREFRLGAAKVLPIRSKVFLVCSWLVFRMFKISSVSPLSLVDLLVMTVVIWSTPLPNHLHYHQSQENWGTSEGSTGSVAIEGVEPAAAADTAVVATGFNWNYKTKNSIMCCQT